MTSSDSVQVLVTGLGATTPLGGDLDATWQALLAGRSGVRALTEPWAESLTARIAATAAVEPADVLEHVEVRTLDRSSQFALIAAREAWQDAGAPEVVPERLAVVCASGIGGVHTLLDNYDKLLARGPRGVSPRAVPMLMANSPAATIGLELGARAGVHTPVSACASGAEAIGWALELIRNGRADVVVCGGTEAAIHPLPMAAFANMQALSKRNDEPERASRPFDKGRDGFVMGEGAAILVLESAEHAARRGVRVYGEVAGQGMAADSHHIAQPEPEGLGAARAMQLALDDGGLKAHDVVHVNAHATSTPLGDLAEAKAIRAVFGDANPCVTAIKSMTGHLLGGAGALEAAVTVKALYERTVPATTNIDDPDDEVGIDIVAGEHRQLPDGAVAAVSNSFGFGGHDVALAFRRSA